MENKIYKRKNITDPELLKKWDYASHRYCSYVGFIKYQQKKYPEKDIKIEWKRSDFINQFLSTGIDPYNRYTELARLGLKDIPDMTIKPVFTNNTTSNLQQNFCSWGAPVGHIEN